MGSVNGPGGAATTEDKAASGAGTRSVYDALRRLILDGELQPGTEISQPELSRRLAVSRTPLREALRLLERERLVVDAGPYRSTRVSSLSPSDLDELYSLRILGEGLAIWLTVPMLRATDIERLQQDAILTAAGDIDAHRRFHAGLRIGAGPRLAEHLEQLADHAERYQRSFVQYEPDREFVAATLAEHQEIVVVCAAGDRHRARELLVDHIAGTAMALMTAERHAPFTLPSAVAMAKGH